MTSTAPTSLRLLRFLACPHRWRNEQPHCRHDDRSMHPEIQLSVHMHVAQATNDGYLTTQASMATSTHSYSQPTIRHLLKSTTTGHQIAGGRHRHEVKSLLLRFCYSCSQETHDVFNLSICLTVANRVNMIFWKTDELILLQLAHVVHKAGEIRKIQNLVDALVSTTSVE